MKSIRNAALFFAAVLALSACTKKSDMAVEAQTGRVVYSVSRGYEVCYNGVVYVQLDVGNSAWGGAKFNSDGKVALCNKPNQQGE